MTRSYERDAKHYDFAVLTHLVETGQASFFDGPGIFVVKTENGTVAVRPHQVIFTATPAPFKIVEEVRVPSPMDGYHGQECYDGEDTGPGGVVYDGALKLALEAVECFGRNSDPLVYVRRILDDEDGEYTLSLRESIDDRRRFGPSKLFAEEEPQRGYLTTHQEDDLLRKFL